MARCTRMMYANCKSPRNLANRTWAENIIGRTDPTFRFRWDAYDQILLSCLAKPCRWLDVGCGENGDVNEFGHLVRLAIGVDLKLPGTKSNGLFVCADILHLPFRSESIDVLSLRFVVEHLKRIPADFRDVERVLRSDGKVVVLTTNVLSPFIAIPRLFPIPLKNFLLRKLYKVDETKILPAFHRVNSPSKMRIGVGMLRPIRIEFLQDANYTRRWLFVLFYSWHLLTRPRLLQRLRTNILAVLKKDNRER